MIIDCHLHLWKGGPAGTTFEQVRDSLLESMRQWGIDLSLVCPDSEPPTDVSDLETTRGLGAGNSGLLRCYAAMVGGVRELARC